MAAASVTSVRDMLAAQLKLNGGADDLEAFWTTITTQAHAEAEAWIRTTLRAFGSTALASWAMFEHYHRRLALFWCGVYGAAILTEDQKALLRLMDCREEIKALDSIGDDPDSETDDAVLGGLMERDDDLFARPSVNSDGSLPGSVFNTPAWYSTRDVR